MTLNTKFIPYIIIGALLIIILLQRECRRPCPECPDVTQIDTVTLLDTLILKDTIYQPQEYYYTDTFKLILPNIIDSLAVVNSFFKSKYYIDTLVNDTNAFIVIRDKVTRNKIEERALLDMVFFPHIKFVTTTIKEPYVPRAKFFAGVGLGRSLEQFGLSPSIMLLTKRDHAYSLSYDVINNDIYFTLYWKIKFNRSLK